MLSKNFSAPINKLTFNKSAFDYVREVKNRHRVVYLSGSHQYLVDQIDQHLKIFLSHLAQKNFNMVGTNKIKFINEKLNIIEFDYLGNSKKDMPIWENCKRIIYTNVSVNLRNIINVSKLEKIEIKADFIKICQSIYLGKYLLFV